MISLTSPVKTRAHDWPAGLKLGLLVVATFVLASTGSLAFHAAAFLGAFALYALPGRVFLLGGLARLRVLWPFVAVMLIWHIWTGDTRGGFVISLRMLTAVGLANLVTMTTRLSDIMGVIHWLLTPLTRAGVNTRALDVGIGLVIRMIPVLIEKSARLRESWRARSRRRTGWRVVMPLVVLALDDADRVSEALKARGGLAQPDPEKK